VYLYNHFPDKEEVIFIVKLDYNLTIDHHKIESFYLTIILRNLFVFVSLLFFVITLNLKILLNVRNTNSTIYNETQFTFKTYLIVNVWLWNENNYVCK